MPRKNSNNRHENASCMKIYFFPGLGADSSLAPLHDLPGYQIEWIDWPKGSWSSWNEFIEEILKENLIEPGQIFAGISFGGLVAQMLSEKVKPNKIVLIGSLQSATDISFLLKALSKVVGLAPSFCFNIGLMPKFLIRTYFGITKKSDLDLFFKMANRMDALQVKQLIHLVLSGKHYGNTDLEVISIHGADDKIIPSKNRKGAYLIKNGGHLISMTHFNETNKAILDRI